MNFEANTAEKYFSSFIYAGRIVVEQISDSKYNGLLG